MTLWQLQDSSGANEVQVLTGKTMVFCFRDLLIIHTGSGYFLNQNGGKLGKRRCRLTAIVHIGRLPRLRAQFQRKENFHMKNLNQVRRI